MQETIAAGYVALWSSVFAHWLNTLITVVSICGSVAIFRTRVLAGYLKRFDWIMAGFQTALTLLLLFLAGIGSGIDAAERDIAKINRALQANCEVGCLRYVAKAQWFWGIPVVGDKERLFIATRHGIRFVLVADIRRIEGRVARQLAVGWVTTLL